MEILKTPELNEGEIVRETVLENGEINMKRVTACAYSESEWSSQVEGEWINVVKGNVVFGFREKTVLMTDGDKLFIPSNVESRIVSTSKTAVWLSTSHK